MGTSEPLVALGFICLSQHAKGPSGFHISSRILREKDCSTEIQMLLINTEMSNARQHHKQYASQKGHCRAHLFCWVHTSSLSVVQSDLCEYGNLNNLRQIRQQAVLLFMFEVPAMISFSSHLLFSSLSFLHLFKLLLLAKKG